ncbi:MAG: type II secretory ATPase GspE/PulE/Tfp pilus assembly ATPase PilB-like protein [bacterium]|jgi:type II secretory ATPase GspE/PulE/Tfp pilus assembly ATPase PilB-like protein
MNSFSLELLFQKLGFQEWKNFVQLPPIEQSHSKNILDYENLHAFTYTYPSYSKYPYLFLSFESNIIKILELVPFLFEETPRYYFCPPKLIQERLYALNTGSTMDQDNLVSELLHYILEKAVQLNASDVHFDSYHNNKGVRLRVDGELETISTPFPIDQYLFTKVKLISGMDISQKRVPQDGHFEHLSKQGFKFDLRTSTVPSNYGESLVIRLLAKTTTNLDIEKLEFSDECLQLILEQIQRSHGLILVTGPTGSGKTTTLYSILKRLWSEKLNIMTIEDPIEYHFEEIRQVEVNEKTGITFAKALRSFLRQDPDIILVGEIRDKETAEVAIQAAQTGHLVLSTMHSSNVFEAINRLKNLEIQNENIGSSVKMILSQRLLPKICTCLGKLTDCEICHGTGRHGRIPVVEMLPFSKAIQQDLMQETNIGKIEEIARKEGFMDLLQNGEKLIQQNKILRSTLQRFLT